MAGVSGVSGSSGSESSSTVTAINDSLGKDAFMKLFITELRYQDAMDPLKDKDFIAQLATFSNLEQLQQLNDGFANFSGGTERIETLNLLGMKVEAFAVNAQGEIDRIDGIVTGVKFKDDGNTATVATADGEREVLVEDVLSVEIPTVAEG